MAHSRAERSRLRHSSSSCECASPARSAFNFIGSSFGISYEIKKGKPALSQTSLYHCLISVTDTLCENVSPVHSFLFLQCFQILHPDCRTRIARHSPVSSRRKCHRTDLRSVRQAGALKLLRKKSSVKGLQPFHDRLAVISSFKCKLCEPIDL